MATAYRIDHQFFETPVRYGKFHLIQIGTLHCYENMTVERHLHQNWFELTVVRRGEGIIYTNGEAIRVRDGDIYLSFPAEFHEIQSIGVPSLHFDFISFQTDHAPYLADLEGIVRRFAEADRRIVHNDAIRNLVRESIAQLQTPKDTPYRDELIGAQLLQLFVLLVRAFQNGDTAASDPLGNTDAKQLCFLLMHYVDTHVYTMRHVRELAEHFNYNYSYLSYLFREVTSQTLSDYFRKKRMETAAGLLIGENLRITQIAQILQYSSVYAFSKAFCAYYGVSPREYREREGIST
jgi:AraC-like DNA-binding protein